MKRIILALAFLAGSIASASATCTSPAVMHDFPGTAFNMSLATNAGDGNCSSVMSLTAAQLSTLTPPAAITGFALDTSIQSLLTSMGLVTASPVSNTMQDRLKSIATSVASIDTKASLALPGQTGIGNVNIGAVQNAGSKFIAVAASQTATVLQSSTGAAGDYLSHCVIYPASTSPGVVTVFDNTNTAATSAILFAGGTTSTSNLTPISVPVGALSVAGAWKVTTGTNVSVVCFGKFS